MQSYLSLIRREAEAPRQGLHLAATTVLAGLAMGASMAVVNAVAGQPKQGANLPNLLLFTLLAGGYLWFRQHSLERTAVIVEAMLSRIRARIVAKLREVDLRTLDAVGRQRVLNTLSHDCFVISEASESMVNGASSAAMLLFSAIYVATLSTLAFVLLCVLVVCAIVYYRRSQRSSRAIFAAASACTERFIESTRHLLYGFREIKLAPEKGQDLFDNFIVPRAGQARDLRVASQRRFIKGLASSQIFFYLLIASVIFILPQHDVDQQIVVKITYIILFIGGPIETLAQSLPNAFKANVAADNLRRLEADLDAGDRDRPGEQPAPSVGAEFKSIVLHDLTFSYPGTYPEENGGPSRFTIGPAALTLRPGEIVFIAGGNGSGKSTLVLLLLALYRPLAGQILWNGVPVDRANAIAYRQLFSVIFADFHLFDRLYGRRDAEPAQVALLLRRFGLERKVSFADGRFSTLDLSTGQRKRLAMIAALLEDKPIAVFDEWAADQDAASRASYYQELLPGLRDRGKTVIAVTHDDRYFHIADRVIHMEEGRIRSEEARGCAEIQG